MNTPILGTPVLVGGKVYQIKQKAIIGNTYTIVCVKCGNTFTTTPQQLKGNIEKCPQCKAIYGYNARKRKGETEESNDSVVPTGKVVIHKTLKYPGVLTWGGLLFKKSVPLHIGVNTIGRTDVNDPSEISFKDEYMSRRSITIDVEKDQNRNGYKFKLTVLRASNPVIVGSSQLMVGNSIYLNYGDTIKLGETILTFKEKKS